MTTQATPSFEERMAPYAEKVAALKAEGQKQEIGSFSIGSFAGLADAKDYTEFIAVLALFEEYEWLERLLLESKGLGEEVDVLNAWVRPEFSSWEPTPLFFITGKAQRESMKDTSRMLRFLKEHGADVNMSAGDGTTPLYNQTCFGTDIKILKTLLELGADPNLECTDNGYQWTPLVNCLLPLSDEEDENSWLPFGSAAIESAKLLLEYGADPNLATSSLPDNPPLVQAVTYGFVHEQKDNPASKDALELVDLLLKSGADPNFTDSSNNTPLFLAESYGLPEVGQLLLSYGAEMPEFSDTETICGLTTTQDCFFRPGAGEPWSSTKEFTKEEVLDPEKKILSTADYKIYIDERTPTSLKGRIDFDSMGLRLDLGEFMLDTSNRVHQTGYKNIAYDTHMQLTLRLLMEETEEKHKGFDDLADVEKELLEKLDPETISDYCYFVFYTPYGSWLHDGCGTPLHALLYYFGVLMIPFKGLLYPEEKFDDLIRKIEDAEYGLDLYSLLFEDFESRYYAYNLLLHWVLAVFDRLDEGKEDAYTQDDLYKGYFDVHRMFVRNFKNYGDIELLGICATNYLMADYLSDCKLEDCKLLMRESLSTYYNLSQRDDLFTENQCKVLGLLNSATSRLMQVYEGYWVENN